MISLDALRDQTATAYLHYRRREAPAVQAQAEALLALETAQGFPLWAGFRTCRRGWALAMQGHGKAGIARLRQGMAAVVATGEMAARPLGLVLLAEAVGQAGQGASCSALWVGVGGQTLPSRCPTPWT